VRLVITLASASCRDQVVTAMMGAYTSSPTKTPMGLMTLGAALEALRYSEVRRGYRRGVRTLGSIWGGLRRCALSK
jgi:hypothetical protein